MAKEDSGTTPMMAQYLALKAQYPDALLFYRMGDFYELFFDDAVAAAAALDIALTTRGKHQGADIKMCGVPHHAAEGYLLTLIRKGFRVAVGEQMESPAEARKRGYKAVVKRDVVRLVTPGTLTEDSLLDARAHNYLAAYCRVRDSGALAWVDVSTGDFHISECTPVMLPPLLARLAPREVLCQPPEEEALRELAAELDGVTTPLSAASFDSANAETRLKALFGVSALDAFGNFSRAELGALGGIVAYLDLTQRGKLPALRPPLRESAGRAMQIDAATRRNLELTRALSGGRAGSLLAAIDRTLTGAGARLLETRLQAPSTDLATIHARQSVLGYFVENRNVSEDVRDCLRRLPDIERALTRLMLDRGGPRDLGALRDAIAQAQVVRDFFCTTMQPDTLRAALDALTGHDDLAALLGQALQQDLPMLARDGGFIASGFDAELDEARQLRDEGRGVIGRLQAQYTADTGIQSLKIKHNNVLGYFIETTATHAEKMLNPPLSAQFIHRQTTANAVRFTTVELSTLETRIANAGAQALEIEKTLFGVLRGAVQERAAQLLQTARAIAEIDLAAGLADLAVEGDWTCPQVDSSRAFAITAGRHPVVEAALRAEGKPPFVANDCDLGADGDEARPIWLLTGPNMAGKSTYLRQNALIALLAQMGAYVPAEAAHIGMVDQLFSRVGAADDLARGRSTFMVEMVETAAILNQAGERALVILDEIGRGTATYDGLSIAWACLEHLHDGNKCRGLFATHYHELTALAGRLKGLRNATVKVREWQNDVIFLHEVVEGAADRSYGVQVARLAGLPYAVVERARAVLDLLEEAERSGGKSARLVDDLPLFSSPAASTPPAKRDTALQDRLKTILPDTLSPREALDLVYELRDLAQDADN